MLNEEKEMLKEMNYLINIRKYLTDTMGNPVLDRKVVKEMSHTLLLVDKKIVGILQHSDFKNYIGFENVKDVVREAIKNTNIKSGLVNK